MTGALRVDAGDRWDAIALLRSLGGLRTSMVQRDSMHWEMRVEIDRDRTILLDDLEERLSRWLVARRLADTVIHLDDGTDRRLHVHEPARG